MARGAASARGVAKARKLGASAMTSMAVSFFCQIVLAGAVTSRDDSVTMQKHAKTTGSMGVRWVHVEFALINGDCDLSWHQILLLRARVHGSI